MKKRGDDEEEEEEDEEGEERDFGIVFASSDRAETHRQRVV